MQGIASDRKDDGVLKIFFAQAVTLVTRNFERATHEDEASSTRQNLLCVLCVTGNG